MKKTDAMYNIVFDEATAVWGNSTMRDWMINTIKRASMINDTQFIAFDNPQIKTEFWFGYSDIGQGRSYDENNKLMENVRNHIIKHFIESNTDSIKSTLERLRDENVQFYKQIHYNGGVNEVVVHDVTPYTRDVETKMMITKEERERVIKAFEKELEYMTKRCHTWLKKYGTEKISISSYWVDR